MLLIPTKALKVGMTLAQPILHPLCDSCVLLTKGAKLKSDYIDRLHKMNVEYVWVDFAGLEEIDGSVNVGISHDHLLLYQAINDSVNQIERTVEIKLNLFQYRKAVRSMLTSIVEDPHHEVMTHQLASCGSVLTGHSANCSYLALLVGAHMTGYLRKQRSALPPEVASNTSELGIGALLHDIGKTCMPDDMLSKSILDPESELPEFQMHARAGYEQAHEHLSVVSSNIILNHHQRYDGTGFPHPKQKEGRRPSEPMAKDNIHIFARIVAVVDVFDHLLCPDGKIVPTIQAIRQMRQPRFAGWFDPVIVETLLRLVPPVQIGTTVTLSNGDEAVVLKNHTETPCLPLVGLLSNELGQEGTKVTGRQLDLRMCPTIDIAAVNGVDVRPYVFREASMPT